MKSIEELKQEFKKDYPTLKNGSDEVGYKELSVEEYETTISAWAENAYAEQQEQEAEAAKAAQKAALLDRLGITEEEAKLLLA